MALTPSDFEFDSRPDAAFKVHTRKMIEAGMITGCEPVGESQYNFRVGYWYGYQAALDFIQANLLGIKGRADMSAPRYAKEVPIR